MYEPKGNAKDRAVPTVQFTEAEPPCHLRGIVHRFLELRTTDQLPQDYRFHALPDACTYMVFDQLKRDVTGVTRLQASSEELSLGRAFHFVNIRFLPGTWQDSVGYGMIKDPYAGPLPLLEWNTSLSGHNFASQQTDLAKFVDHLVRQNYVAPNPVTERIFAALDEIYSVADMAHAASLSPRQLQRVLKKTTGFAPHDFLKVIRLQQSIRGEPSLSYADQSHFIHSLRKATGYTPGQYAKKFDV
ncbi:MAG: helix-turn-helix domain-containing protein [Roseobacter sp.]